MVRGGGEVLPATSNYTINKYIVYADWRRVTKLIEQKDVRVVFILNGKKEKKKYKPGMCYSYSGIYTRVYRSL